MVDDAPLLEAYRLLDLEPKDLLVASVAELEKIRARVKRKYRELIPLYHPDRIGNDPVRGEIFLALGAILEEFEKIETVSPPVGTRVTIRTTAPRRTLRERRRDRGDE